MKGEMNRVVMVYVDSYENENPKGRFCIAANGEIQTFQSTIQLIMQKCISATICPAVM